MKAASMALIALSAACASPAVTRVSIQVNWFRGDDEELPACALHKLDPIALLAAGEKA